MCSFATSSPPIDHRKGNLKTSSSVAQMTLWSILLLWGGNATPCPSSSKHSKSSFHKDDLYRFLLWSNSNICSTCLYSSMESTIYLSKPNMFCFLREIPKPATLTFGERCVDLFDCNFASEIEWEIKIYFSELVIQIPRTPWFCCFKGASVTPMWPRHFIEENTRVQIFLIVKGNSAKQYCTVS